MSAINLAHSNGKPAVKILADQTGFCYYADGTIALCAAISSDYQNNHYAYDRNGQLLLAIDALGVGYVQSSKRPAADVHMFNCTFNTSGAVISIDDIITKEWKWANIKGHPASEIKERLNENIVFQYEDREHMYLHFECDGAKFTADLSVKQRRKEPSYLATATRDSFGRLVVSKKSKTLKQRTEDFNKSMAFKNNLVHPKSENLSDMVSGIVSGLERQFNGIDQNMMTNPSPGKTWKSDALDTTITELPKICPAGTETGKFNGLGKNIYSETDAATTKMSQTLPKHLLTATGTWKNDTDVRASLQTINPVLKRTNVLKCNSGRYSDMLVVDPTKITFQNPTGMVVTEGLPVPLVRWAQFKAEMEEGGRVSNPSQLLTVAIIGRLGEARYSLCMRMVEQANLLLSKEDDSGSPKFRLVQIEVGENSRIIQDLNLRYLPTFAMWNGGRLAYLGQAGGQKVGLGPSFRPKVLLIENAYKFQLATEKLLKKASCDSFLCLTASAAIDAVQKVMTASGTDNCFDLVLVAQDIIETQASELSILRGKIAGDVESGKTVVAAMYDVLGGERGMQNLKGFSWDRKGLSEDVGNIPGGTRLFNRVAQKPMKAVAIETLLGMRSYMRDDLYVQLGVTPESLLGTMNTVRENVIRGDRKDPSVFKDLHLSIQDAKFKGSRIVK
jgi:hypothetical protein